MSDNSLSADQNGLTSNVNLLSCTIFDVLFFSKVTYYKASTLTGGARIMPEKTFMFINMSA